LIWLNDAARTCAEKSSAWSTQNTKLRLKLSKVSMAQRDERKSYHSDHYLARLDCTTRGLPADVRAKLESEIAAFLNSPDVKKQFNDIGFDVVASNRTQFTEFLAGETQRWKKVVKAGNITAE
jgi:hypothetical protein